MLSGSSSQEQTVEQALRRLKYLHTSLTQPKSCHAALKGLWTSGHRDDHTKGSIPQKTAKCEIFCLQPPRKGENKKYPSALVQPRNKVCKGRAPLVSPTAYFNPSCTPAGHSIVERTELLKFRHKGSPLNRKRLSRSAPVSPGQEKCEECTCSDREISAGQKNTSKTYDTNMKINQVMFSVRPQTYPRADKIHSNHQTSKKIRFPETCCNGWGIRVNKRRLTGNQINIDTFVEVESGMRTMRLEPKDCHDRTLRVHGRAPHPPPPPTPVQQVDIQLPNRRIVQYWLQNLE